MGKILVIGSGITGCTAAFELAQQGYNVDLIDKANRVGGKVLTYCCKATDECSRCGVCVAHTKISETLNHKNIRVLTASVLDNVENSGKRVSASLTQLLPAYTPTKCSACDTCMTVCPTKCITKYHRGGVVQYSIDHEKCLRHKGRACNKCVTACPTRAIRGKGTKETIHIHADTMLIATGHSVYDAAQTPPLGYGRLEGVLDGEQAEAILAGRTFLKSPTDDVAFVQCVGSRDPHIGRNYCSATCCAYATRMARILKYRNPESTVTVYYIDLQNFDKTFSCLRAKLAEEGVRLVQGVPVSIDRTSEGKLLLKREGTHDTPGAALHDLVVLSVGMGPTPNAKMNARTFGVTQDEFGFFNSDQPNVFVAGTCHTPQTIPDSMASAKAAAANMIGILPSPKSKPTIPDRDGTIKIRHSRNVLVLGGGLAGATAARRLKDLGHKTVLVEREANTGGTAATLRPGDTSFDELLSGTEIIRNARLTRLTGQIGTFQTRIQTSRDEFLEKKFGAIIVSTGADISGVGDNLYDFDRVFPVQALSDAMSRYKRKDRPRSLGIVLDMNVEETTSSMEESFHLAIRVIQQYPCEITIFCREVRVASKFLEKLYDEARQAGVIIVKYEGSVDLSAGEDLVGISVQDALLDRDITVPCEVVGVSPWGIRSAIDPDLASTLSVRTDALGQIQDNNIHLFPDASNRPGIFVAGACRGRYDRQGVINDALSAALQVHDLLSRKTLTAELDNALVDATKCVLCLTCVRTCPHGAMTIDEVTRAAKSAPEACQKCGVCVGECPARAISLPALDNLETLSPRDG